ncbi:RNA 2',3'-cyclic phosphodiesterase [Embleya sp. NBC_00888]|uniref:RNA 2',3'-cyclic phosphodiesterase n=1 Tax=Embleya sp. NBC_00888 TaxID=2975960 RepID=UPI00386F657C|nr:RNA 2',3'-cyclic phosphodiesterase [Embleya sp. NBC_00888]
MIDDAPTPPRTVRLFVALAPPDDAKDELARALRPVYAAHPRLRWNRIEDWHITLAFLGEVALDVVEALRAPLAEVAASTRPVELELRGAGQFDERVLWSDVRGDLAALHTLADAVRGVVRAGGVVSADRPLRAHLTLARARRDNPDGIGAAARELEDFLGRRWSARRLHLVGSNFGRGPGPIHYRDVDAWPLAGR